ncbi:MAG: RecX family transcriptional regulator [Elioraea sp.]|nr:RecX family transcriptional regulator [Elioraea sp.]
MRGSPRAPERPTAAALEEAALAHLARYATTRAGLLRVLERRIARWAAASAAEEAEIARARAEARRVVERLAAAGAVDDAAFAEARARRLARAGRSAVAIAAHLADRGAGEEAGAAIAAALPDEEAAVAAALIALKRRRLGPFAADRDATREKALGALARAGFSRRVAEAALAAEPEEAEALIARFRRA